MIRAFQPMYSKTTPANELNFIGAAIKYFGTNTKNCTDETKDAYVKYYNDYIFPLIDQTLPIKEYRLSTIKKLMAEIQDRSGHRDNTIQSRAHLLLDPIDAYYSEVGVYRNPLYGTSLRFGGTGKGAEERARLLKIKKSFSVEEELALAKVLLSDPETDDGALIGLAVMFLSGSRNGEACGYDFRDLLEMREHPGCYYLRMYRTTVGAGNELKAGGKTRNAPRNIPIPKVLSDFLIKRKDYISTKITFPYRDANGCEYASVDDLPIACKGNAFWDRCDVPDLSAAGRKLLREDIKMALADFSDINYLIEQEMGTEEDLGEREPTTYLFRRNMATHLYTLGFNMTQIQYYMGHMLEATTLSRADFVDEALLYDIYCLLQAHPLNQTKEEAFTADAGRVAVENQFHLCCSIDMGSPGETYRLRVCGREWNDPITIQLDSNTGSCRAELRVEPQDKRPGAEVNVTKAIHASYAKHDHSNNVIP